jgi:hypothetical protein
MRNKIRFIVTLILMLALPVSSYAAISLTEECHEHHHAMAIAQADDHHHETNKITLKHSHTHKGTNQHDCGEKCLCGGCLACSSCGAFILGGTHALSVDGGVLEQSNFFDRITASIVPEGLLRPPSTYRTA